MLPLKSNTAQVAIVTIVMAALMATISRGTTACFSSAVRAETIDQSMEAWWLDLEKDEPDASRALLELRARPVAAVAFLKGKMKPLTISTAQVKELLRKLGDAAPSISNRAFEELEYFDPRLAIHLQDLMAQLTDSPARQRMVEVLSGLEPRWLHRREIELLADNGDDRFSFLAIRSSWDAESKVERINSPRSWSGPNLKKKWTRAVRCIVLLEYLHIPEADAILKDMATGHPDAQPTRVARQALEGHAEKTTDASWLDLEKGEVDACRALLALGGNPREAVALIKGKIKPLTIKPVEVKRLLLKLGSADESVWKPAFEELEYFDPRLAIDLQELMARVTETPARQRLVEVLSGRDPGSLEGKEVRLNDMGHRGGFNFFNPETGSWWAEYRVSRINSGRGATFKKKWARCVRAIVLLEQIHTPEAIAILEEMAGGHADAKPTRVAREALGRTLGIDR
jgi:hypothetical protein